METEEVAEVLQDRGCLSEVRKIKLIELKTKDTYKTTVQLCYLKLDLSQIKLAISDDS